MSCVVFLYHYIEELFVLRGRGLKTFLCFYQNGKFLFNGGEEGTNGFRICFALLKELFDGYSVINLIGINMEYIYSNNTL